jgi:hypothetical protein
VLASTLALPSAVWAQPGLEAHADDHLRHRRGAGGSVDLYARGIKSALETLNLVNGQTVVPTTNPAPAACWRCSSCSAAGAMRTTWAPSTPAAWPAR